MDQAPNKQPLAQIHLKPLFDRHSDFQPGLEVAPRPYKDSEGLQHVPDAYHDYQIYPDQAYPVASPPQHRRSTICGLRKVIFLAVVLVVLIVIAVAAGVGGFFGTRNKNAGINAESSPMTLSSASSSSSITTPIASISTITASITSTAASSSSSTTTRTPSPLATSGTTGIAADSCNFTDPRTYYTNNIAFLQFCYVDWPSGDATFAGTGTVADIDGVVAYTFEACMDACASYKAKSGGPSCQAVTYNANLTSAVAFSGHNCYLKSARGVAVMSTMFGDVASSLVASAARVE